MKKTLAICLLSMSILAACKTTKQVTTAKKPVEEAKVVTEERVANPAIAKGKTIFTEQCGACHRLKMPESFTAEKWTAIVPIMVQKTNKKAAKEVINAEDEKAILAYVLSACKK